MNKLLKKFFEWLRGADSKEIYEMSTSDLKAEYTKIFDDYIMSSITPNAEFRLDIIETELERRGWWVCRGSVGVSFFPISKNGKKNKE